VAFPLTHELLENTDDTDDTIAAMKQDLVFSHDQEVLKYLRSIAPIELTYDQSLIAGQSTFVSDEHAALALMEGSFEAPFNIKFVGTLNNAIKVYCDPFADENTPVLVGYKGSNDIDAGVFDAIYTVGKIVESTDTSVSVGFQHTLIPNTTNLVNSSDYYCSIAIKNIRWI